MPEAYFGTARQNAQARRWENQMRLKVLLTLAVLVLLAACLVSPLAMLVAIALAFLGLVGGATYWFCKFCCRPKIAASIAGVVTLFLLAVFIAGVARARPLAIRRACQSNLHCFDLALSAYCYPPRDFYPTTLWSIGEYDVSPLMFICPGHYDLPDTVHLSMSNISQYADLIYVAGLGPDCPADVPVILCPPINHNGKGGNVLFGDHRTRWMPAKEFDRVMAWTYAYAESNGLGVVVSDALTKRSNGRYRSRP